MSIMAARALGPLSLKTSGQMVLESSLSHTQNFYNAAKLHRSSLSGNMLPDVLNISGSGLPGATFYLTETSAWPFTGATLYLVETSLGTLSTR